MTQAQMTMGRVIPSTLYQVEAYGPVALDDLKQLYTGLALPWKQQRSKFRRVAVIAGSHHERLNGTGYPNRLHSAEIPLQSKMMTISDIFDALTASDRPYKRAVPVEKALDILGFEVKDGHVDAELVRIFTEAKPWEQIMGALY